MSDETDAEYFARIGSKEAMEERQRFNQTQVRPRGPRKATPIAKQKELPHTIIPPSTLQSQPKGKGFPVPVKRWQQRGSSGN